MSPTTSFAPASTPADAIAGLSMLVLEMTGAIFVVVCGVLVEAIDGTVVGDTVHSEG